MELNHDELDELLGAYAIDAIDADERDQVEALLARYPELVHRVVVFQEAATGLLAGSLRDEPAPADLRAGVLGRASAARPPGRHVANPTGSDLAPVEIWRRQFADLDDLLDELDGDDWTATTSFHRSVHELLAHLSGGLDLYCTEIGAGTFDIPAGTPVGHWELTEPRIADLVARPPAETVRTLRDTAARIEQRLAALDRTQLNLVEPDRALSVADRTRLLSFEMWMHTDDVRRATGRRLVDPDPARVCALSDLSARFVGLGMASVGRDHAGHRGRLVLTGPGGGTWVVPLALESPRSSAGEVVTVIADAIDYCRMAGQLLAVEDLAIEVEGDPSIAIDLLHGAQAFAV